MSFKQEKVIVIISEFVNDKREFYPITNVPVEKARFFYKDDDGLFKVMASSDYAVRTELNETRLYITNVEIKEKSTKFQVGYEINFTSSEYETSLPVLSVLVEMYNTLIEDSRTIFNYVKKQCFISDDKTTSLILPNLPSYTVWCMGENGEMFALPVNELYSKFGEMLNKLKSILADYTESKKEEIRGATFFPHLIEDGTLSWTNDKNKPNPEPVNIKGPSGTIENVTASVDSNTGVPSVKVTMSGTKENRSFNLEFQNLKGDKPIKGEDYLTPAEKDQFTTETKNIVKAEGTKVIEQVKTIVAGNPATTNALTLSGKTRVEFENDTNKNKADLNYGFAVITDELCLPPILPPSSETGQIIELSDSKTGYFYWDRDNKVSWQNRDLGYRTKVIRVNEGEKYRLKCTLNGGVPVYVLSSTDYTTLPGLNSAIQVFPKRQLSGNETFDVVVTIPKFVEFLSFGYIANQEAKMIKFKTPSEPTLKTRVLNCEDDIVETNKRIDETNKRIDGLNPGETPIEPPKIAKDIVKYYLNNVVCVGDSLTAGYYHDGSKYLVAKENYPFYLKKILNCKIVDNYSESGYTSKDWYRKFSSKVQWANYDTVIIWLGTNGGLSDTVENDTANGFADTYTGHYCHIIDDAIKANPNIRIFLGTVFAVGGGSVSDKAGTNAVINKIATKYSSNVLGVVDNDNGELYLGENQNLYHPFYKFNGDMLHFGKVGNLHLAKHYVDEICKIIEKDESKMEVLFNELN